MKVLYAPTSPFSAKVRMAARYCGFDIESVPVNSNESPLELTSQNPLGKIPTLITDTGQAIFDSRVIMQFLNRESGGKLYPSEHSARTAAESLEALSDGTTDALLAHVYERRFRPEEIVHQPWLDRQWGKATRAMEYIQANPPKIDGALNGGHFSLAALAAYLKLRFAGEWEDKCPALLAFGEEFGTVFPDYDSLKPQ